MDVLSLSRIQFAFTISFHYIFPTINIGLSVLMVIMEGLYLKTKNPFYHNMARFWTKVFGLAFAVGVATGIVMEFEFGTNWAEYSRYVGDVFGSALAAEGLFAFFLESGFLGLLLFGWDKVKPITHFFASVMVSLGAHFSAIWIVAANSWMQTPAGYHIVETETISARAEITDFMAMVFNPSFIMRLVHVIGGCWQAGAALVLSISAYYLIKNEHVEFAKVSFKLALLFALFSSVVQIVSGDFSAKIVAEYQPVKLAAMEAHFEELAPADGYIVGWVNEEKQEVTGIKIPGMTSFLTYGDSSVPIKGINAFPEEDRPPVSIVFQAFHIMVSIGFFLVSLHVFGIFLLLKNKLFTLKPVLWIFVFSILLPQIANFLGWVTAEVGRQPWIVYELLRTSDSLSRTVTEGMVFSSLIFFILIYSLIFILFIFLLHQKIKTGPQAIEYSEQRA